MKYHSELIKEIVEKRGHHLSSPHYESECVKTWIEETKGAYPKLCDYESEWLNYINENPLGVFPYETLVDITKATVDNVVPYAYKSAILKGQTLVNLSGKSTSDVQTITGTAGLDISLRYTLKSSTVYTAIFNVLTIESPNDLWCGFLGTSGWGSNSVSYSMGINKIKLTTHEDSKCAEFRIRGSKNTFKNLIILEGDYTKTDIPYFEGMQSVKMPVLTTTGKNLITITSYDKECYNEIGLNEYELVEAYHNKMTLTNLLSRPIYQSTVLTYTAKTTDVNKPIHIRVEYTDGEVEYSSVGTTEYSSRRWNITKPIRSVRIVGGANGTTTWYIKNLQLEVGSTATTYEPYKTNILTVNEDVTLRSNGDVYDELNLLTGRLTQRIDENNEVLAQEVVKTVGLAVVNQDGDSLSKLIPIEGTMHLSTSGKTINPLFSGEIPVEAITQNLASFIGE